MMPGPSPETRFPDEPTTARLLAVRWLDWDAAKITRNVRAICGSEVAALESAT
jgi:virginiamycin A acetyltransferase